MGTEATGPVWTVHELLHGTTSLLARATSSPGSDVALVAQNIRWAQELGGDEPRGLVEGSVEPLRQRAQGLPNTHGTVRAAGIVGDDPPRDDDQWRIRHLHAGLAAADVVRFVRDEARERGCAGWVPTTLLGQVQVRSGADRNVDRQVCSHCHMQLPIERFESESRVCRDCE